MKKVFPISAENANEMCKSMNWMDSEEAQHIFSKIEGRLRGVVEDNIRTGKLHYGWHTIFVNRLSEAGADALNRLGYHVVIPPDGDVTLISWDVKKQNEQP